jgi:geranylgeranyl diphosphate synthase type II
MELASPEQRAEMLAWMENPAADDDAKVAYFTSLYTSLGVKEVCEKRIAELFAKCDAFIENLSVSAERKANLKAFANSLLNRKV